MSSDSAPDGPGILNFYIVAALIVWGSSLALCAFIGLSDPMMWSFIVTAFVIVLTGATHWYLYHVSRQ